MNRNDPCHCGSGKRYKHCHGLLDARSANAEPFAAEVPTWPPRAGPSPLHLEAVKAHRAGSLASAEALYRKAIASDPDDAASLHLLGAVLNDRFRRHEAMEYIAQAAERTGWQAHIVRADLASVLATMLSPRANPPQQALIAAYRERENVRRREAPAPVHVSIVMTVSDDVEWRESTASVADQTFADIDLVIVDTGAANARAADLAAIAANFPFTVQVLSMPMASAAAAANAGARAASGPWLAFLAGGDRFAPERIERMVGAVVRAEVLWGYSRMRDEAPVPTAHDGAPGGGAPLAVPDALTPGFSLLTRDAARAADNLFVPRDFFLSLGGFHDTGAARGWDFRVRAAMRVEPVVVDDLLYLPRTAATSVSAADAARIPEELVAAALAGRDDAPNPLGPWQPHHRDVLLRWLLNDNRGRFVPVPVLKSLVESFREETRASQRSPAIVRSRDAQRRAIVVLGVYRSGTSALTRALNLCGALLPEAVHSPQMGLNPTGFWETEDVTDLDSRLIEQLGGKWNRVDFKLPDEGPVIDEFRDDVHAILREVYHDAPLILIKDPRICALGPAWHRALTDYGYRPGYVVSVRHPLEVAKSLRAGGGGTLQAGLALWRAFMCHVQDFVATVDAPVLHMNYEMLLQDWRAVITRVGRRLDVPLDVARGAEVDRFLDGTLHNQRGSDEELAREAGPAEAAAILAQYRGLTARCAADAADSGAT
ncbi:MAG: glycosyltransferase [Casimicrobiaceae bacterium]